MGRVMVAGLDGCPGGWVSVSCEAGRPDAAQSAFHATFAAALDACADCLHVAVDIPIGLPERGGLGGRLADVEARRRLGGRQSAVFAVPSRAAVMQADYRDACAVAAATSDPPRKVAKQTFHLFPKIREVDRVMTPVLQSRVVECHPELAFWSLNGGQPLPLPKKVKSRPHEPGLALRRDLLAAAGFLPAFLNSRPFRARDVGADDLLDATACCAAALRMADGSAMRVPSHPPLDARGLRMEIWG